MTACNTLDAKFRTVLGHVEVSGKGVVAFAKELHEILDEVLSKSPPLCKKCISGYAGRNMVRKVVLSWLRGCLCDTAGHSEINLCWNELNFSALEEAGAVADVNGKAANDIVDACGGTVIASEVSDLVLGRPDHALFVSMWACLFTEVAQRNTDSETRGRILESLSSPRAAEVLDAFLLEHGGVPPCPHVLVRLLLAPE